MASLPPEAQAYLKHMVGKISAVKSEHHTPHPLQTQPPIKSEHHASQIPTNTITPALRAYIDDILPRLFAAMRCLQDPNGNPETHHAAREFQAQFKAGLPPEGHGYIEEVVMRMTANSRDRRIKGEGEQVMD